MLTGNQSNYQVLYMNPDGQMVSGFKAHYEGSMAFIVHDNGFHIPAWMVWGDSWK